MRILSWVNILIYNAIYTGQVDFVFFFRGRKVAEKFNFVKVIREWNV